MCTSALHERWEMSCQVNLSTTNFSNDWFRWALSYQTIVIWLKLIYTTSGHISCRVTPAYGWTTTGNPSKPPCRGQRDSLLAWKYSFQISWQWLLERFYDDCLIPLLDSHRCFNNPVLSHITGEAFYSRAANPVDLFPMAWQYLAFNSGIFPSTSWLLQNPAYHGSRVPGLCPLPYSSS